MTFYSNILLTSWQKGFFYCFIFLLVSCSSSKKNMLTPAGWQVISETKADFIRQTEVIKVYSIDRFTDIRFRVDNRAIKISAMTIYFANGDKLSANISDVIQAGDYSRNINLADNGKKLDRIELKYRTTGNILKGRAKVILIGKPYIQGPNDNYNSNQ
jgi:hypothetical protein